MALLSLLAVLACPSRGAKRQNSFEAALPDTTSGLEYPEESTYGELARQIPSLGGWYFDTVSGNLVVYLKNLGEADSAKSLLRTRLAHEVFESRRRHPQADVVTRQAAYTWLELKHWRDLLRQVMPDTPGMVTLGISEDRNRVEVGVDSAADSVAVRKLARRRRIPDEALVIEVTGRIVPFLKPPPSPPG